jgi:hypothetical protein
VKFVIQIKNTVKMDIDLTTIIIAVIGLSIFIIPVILDRLSEKKRSKGIETEFLALAKNQNVKISHYDVWRNSNAIGIDQNSKKVFFLKKQKESNQEILIDLAQVKKCRIVKTDSKNHIGLTFTFSEAGKPETTLDFYSKNRDNNPDGEYKLAEKWLGIINLKLL